jgi:Carboxypeptidase regulatory-like domain/Bacterial Ig-like domain (group 2)
MSFWHRSVALLSIGSFFVSGCGGGGTPPAPTPVTPIVTSVAVTGVGSPRVGDSVQLTATATLSDGTSQAITAQATWESSNQAIVTITSGGMATFVGQGDADIKATYKTVSGSQHVTVSTRTTPKFTLVGTVTDSTNGNPLPNVNARIVDGADAGRTATTDGSGRYSFSNVSSGTFLVQFTRSDYETRSISVSVGGDTTADVKITANVASVTRFYGTYNTNLTILQQTCDATFNVGPTGTFKLEGNTSGSSMTVTIVERGTTRTYNGSIRGDGSFSGNGGGIIAGFSPPQNKHEYNGSIAGTTNGSRLDATEFVNFTIPCPGATMRIGYSGSK